MDETQDRHFRDFNRANERARSSYHGLSQPSGGGGGRYVYRANDPVSEVQRLTEQLVEAHADLEAANSTIERLKHKNELLRKDIKELKKR
jgi:hypothetical protein